MKCPICEKENSDDFKHCAHCGQRLLPYEAEDLTPPVSSQLKKEENAAVPQEKGMGKAFASEEKGLLGGGPLSFRLIFKTGNRQSVLFIAVIVFLSYVLMNTLYLFLGFHQVIAYFAEHPQALQQIIQKASQKNAESLMIPFFQMLHQITLNTSHYTLPLYFFLTFFSPLLSILGYLFATVFFHLISVYFGGHGDFKPLFKNYGIVYLPDAIKTILVLLFYFLSFRHLTLIQFPGIPASTGTFAHIGLFIFALLEGTSFLAKFFLQGILIQRTYGIPLSRASFVVLCWTFLGIFPGLFLI